MLRAHVHTDELFDMFTFGDFTGFIDLVHLRREAATLPSGILPTDFGSDSVIMVITPNRTYALRAGDVSKVDGTFAAFEPVSNNPLINSNSFTFVRDTYSKLVTEIQLECLDANCSDEELENKMSNAIRNRFVNNFPAMGIKLYEAEKDSNNNYIWKCLD